MQTAYEKSFDDAINTPVEIKNNKLTEQYRPLTGKLTEVRENTSGERSRSDRRIRQRKKCA